MASPAAATPCGAAARTLFQTFDTKQLAVSIHRLGDAVGVEDDQVARLEGNGDWPVKGGRDDTQRRSGTRAADGLDRARCRGAPGGPCARH